MFFFRYFAGADGLGGGGEGGGVLHIMHGRSRNTIRGGGGGWLKYEKDRRRTRKVQSSLSRRSRICVME